MRARTHWRECGHHPSHQSLMLSLHHRAGLLLVVFHPSRPSSPTSPLLSVDCLSFCKYMYVQIELQLSSFDFINNSDSPTESFSNADIGYFILPAYFQRRSLFQTPVTFWRMHSMSTLQQYRAASRKHTLPADQRLSPYPVRCFSFNVPNIWLAIALFSALCIHACMHTYN